MPTPKTVTRADLAEAIVRKTKLPRNEANRLLTTMLELIEEALIAGDTVKLSRFGNFVVRRKNERVGRNPKTGKEVPITPRRVVTFRASQMLREFVESGGRRGAMR